METIIINSLTMIFFLLSILYIFLYVFYCVVKHINETYNELSFKLLLLAAFILFIMLLTHNYTAL